MSTRVACCLALVGVVQADSVHKTFDVREWVVDYQRPTAEPRRLPYDVPTADKMLAQLANNAFPGPAIEAFVGDEIQVTVVNQMLAQHVDFAWEGVQVTQPAPAPIVQQGANFTYKMVGQTAGTFWWHAKLPVQAAHGLKGALVVRARDDAASASYQDEQVVVLSDALRAPELCLGPSGALNVDCPLIDKATFNGQWGDGSKGYPVPTLVVEEGKCYLLRWLGLQTQASDFEVEIQSHVVKLIDQGSLLSKFAVAGGTSVNTVLCADQEPGRFNKGYKIDYTYSVPGQPTRSFQAVLQYTKKSEEPDFHV